MSKATIILLSIVLIGMLVRYLYLKPSQGKGEIIEDFSAITIDQQSYTLSKDESKYILLHFWGSWCGPCRQENRSLFAPLLQKMNTTSSTNLKIVNIAVERDSVRSRNAIEVDQLIHPAMIHIIQDDYFASTLAKKYGVRSIPTSYLLDGKSLQVLKVNPDLSHLASILN